MRFPGSTLTIFSRLVLGYLIIFLLVIAMNLYTIVQIGHINQVTQSVLLTNNRMVDYLGKLTDAVLSQVANERKFLITKDRAFYNQFVRLQSDCDQYFDEASFIADAPEIKGFLSRARDSHRSYQSLFHEELKHLREGRGYSQQRYGEEKERATNVVLEELDHSREYTQRNTYDKIKQLYEAGADARKMAMVMTGAFLMIGLVISFTINRSITRPIALLKKKTREIAKGNLRGDLALASPPEIGELAAAFNLMCNKLQELDKMKSDFFSSMSHELRTPLSTIKMGIGLLQDGTEGAVTENQRKLLSILDEESSRLIEQVNALLDLSKMEAGMMTYTFEQKGIVPLIDKAIQEIGPLLKSKNINVEARAEEKLPILRIDTERILQALRNLVGNAAKFTPPGGQVSVSARSVNGGVEVSVADTGPGIAPEHLTTIFERFKQVNSKGSQRIKGTGLGLAITKQIITHHGGKIWAESKLGHGSTFTFLLPV